MGKSTITTKKTHGCMHEGLQHGGQEEGQTREARKKKQKREGKKKTEREGERAPSPVDPHPLRLSASFWSSYSPPHLRRCTVTASAVAPSPAKEIGLKLLPQTSRRPTLQRPRNPPRTKSPKPKNSVAPRRAAAGARHRRRRSRVPKPKTQPSSRRKVRTRNFVFQRLLDTRSAAPSHRPSPGVEVPPPADFTSELHPRDARS
jgi:hypothetical protein